MIKILFCVLSVWCATAFAQVPSFRSFNPPQFSTNGFIVSLKDPLVATNITVISNLVSQTIITTNLYVTNLYVTNIVNDITFNGRVTFNTNVTFVTNVVGGPTPWQLASIDWSSFAHTNLFFPSLPVGTNDLFTVPAGLRAITVGGMVTTTNTSASSYALHIKTNSAYYQFIPSATVSTNSIQSILQGPVFDEGETISASSSTDGLCVQVAIATFSTNVPIYSAKIFGLATGTNTLYVVPGNKVAYHPSGMSFQAAAGLNVCYMNTTGFSTLLRTYFVPSGASVDNTTVSRIATITNGAQQNSFFIFRISTETRVVLDADVAGGFAYLNVRELNQ